MNKSIKNKLLAILLGCFLMFSVLAMLPTVTNVSASNSFANLEVAGAGIMLKDGTEGAIRFNVQCSTTEHELIDGDSVQSGVLIMPSDLLGNNELTIDFSTTHAGKTVVPRNKVLDGYWNAEGTTHYSSYVYLYGIPAESYDREITARAYVIVDGETKPYYSEPIERCIAYVAAMASTAQEDEFEPEELELIDTYRTKYEVKFYDDANLLDTKQVMYGAKTGYAIEDSEDGDYIVKNVGWVDSKGEDVSLDFVTENLTVYAKKERLLKVNETFDVELSSGGKLDLNETLTGFSSLNEPKAYLFDGEGYSQDSALTLTDGVLAYAGNPIEDFGEKSVVVSDGTNGYAFDILAVTDIITTFDEFKVMQTAYGNDAKEENNYEYTGYFVLGNNIDANGQVMTVNAPYRYNTSFSSMGWWYPANANGFKGTFDGRGYTVSNLALEGQTVQGEGTYCYGIFGDIAQSGVVKNVAFTNVTNGNSTDHFNYSFGILATIMAGTIENVYVQSNDYFHGVFRAAYAYSTFTNVVAEGYGNVGSPLFATGVGSSNYTFNNVTVVVTNDFNSGEGYTTLRDVSGEGNTLDAYLESATVDGYKTAGFTTDIWYLENGKLPVFKSMKPVEIDGISTYDLNGTQDLVIDLADYNVKKVSAFNISGKAATFDYSNNKITVSRSVFATLDIPFGDYVYTFNGDDRQFNGNLAVVTKVITTFDELKVMQTAYGNDANESNNYEYTGYFVLGNNIDANGQVMTVNAPYRYNTSFTGMYNDTTCSVYGFQGIFDGRGYTISNLGVEGRTVDGEGTYCYGVFGGIASGAVVKNVAFVNLTNGNTTDHFNYYFGALAATIAGKVENVYIQTTDYYYSLCRFSFSSSKYSNLVIEGYGFRHAAMFPAGNATEYNNVTVVVANKDIPTTDKYTVLYDITGEGNTLTTYLASATVDGYKTAGFTTDIWYLENGKLPVFNSMKQQG